MTSSVPRANTHSRSSAGRDCGLCFISGVRYGVWYVTGIQTSLVKALRPTTQTCPHSSHGPHSTLFLWHHELPEGRSAAIGSHLLPVTSGRSVTLSKCISAQSFSLCPSFPTHEQLLSFLLLTRSMLKFSHKTGLQNTFSYR